jgi:hypothetical protein
MHTAAQRGAPDGKATWLVAQITQNEHTSCAAEGTIALRVLVEDHNHTLAYLDASENAAHEALFLRLSKAIAGNVQPPACIHYRISPAVYHIKNRIRNNTPRLQGACALAAGVSSEFIKYPVYALLEGV